jgi:hypothetical protein
VAAYGDGAECGQEEVCSPFPRCTRDAGRAAQPATDTPKSAASIPRLPPTCGCATCYSRPTFSRRTRQRLHVTVSRSSPRRRRATRKEFITLHKGQRASDIPVLLPVPDPDRPTPGNRRINFQHAKKFGEYIKDNSDWVAPPLLARDDDRCVFREQQIVAAGMALGILDVPLAVGASRSLKSSTANTAFSV